MNLPPGCSVSDIPGNSQADADWEHNCEMASAVVHSAIPWLLDSISTHYSEKLVEAIATALMTAHEVGESKGFSLGRADARMEAIENQETS